MPHDIVIATEAELRRSVQLDERIVDIVEEAFRALARGDVVMPPVLSMDLPMVNGEVDVKTAYIPGFDGFAIKVSPGFFDNPSKGLASLNGLMVLLDASTGLVKAVFLDNGYLTDVRTAAAGAVAATGSLSRSPGLMRMSVACAPRSRASRTTDSVSRRTLGTRRPQR